MQKIIPSIIATNQNELAKRFATIKDLGSIIHLDVMDGLFVPRYGLYPEILTYLKKVTNIPVDVHMMVSNPEDYINDFHKASS